jgi:hypothetical protein
MRTTIARSLAVGALVLVAVGGCKGRSADPPASGSSTSSPPASATSSASPSPGGASPSASPSPTPDAAIVFAADGIGPYVIGTGLSELQSRSLVTGVYESLTCADSKGAETTGRYAGQVTLLFKAERLTAVNTQSAAVVTPSGARVGMTLAQLQALYGSRGTLITGMLGNKAYVVRVLGSGLAIVFYLDSTNTRVASMSGGEATPLEEAARVGEGC